MVVPVARGLPRRQRHADRRLGEPDGRGLGRAQRRPLPLHDLYALRHADDGGFGRHLPRLRLVAIFLTARQYETGCCRAGVSAAAPDFTNEISTLPGGGRSPAIYCFALTMQSPEFVEPFGRLPRPMHGTGRGIQAFSPDAL